VANVNQVIKEHTTTWTRISDGIVAMSATRKFVLFHVTAVLAWVVINLAIDKGFDPFPFALLGLTATLESIFLSIFVLISQNRQTEKERIRSDLDYQVNVKAHVEVMELHRKIDELKTMVEGQGGRQKDEG